MTGSRCASTPGKLLKRSAPEPVRGAEKLGRVPCRLCDNQAMSADAADLGPLTRRIVELLESRGVAHRLMRHAPVLTSEEASRVRGTPLQAGATGVRCHVR